MASTQVPTSGFQSLTASDWMLMASIITATTVAVIGWTVTYWLNRKLQRKQLAIQILYEHRFQTDFIKAQRRLFKALRSDTERDYKRLIQDHLNPKVTQSETDLELCEDIKLVLNFFEFIAVAVLSKSVNAEIIYHDISGGFMFAYKKLKPAIEAIVDGEKDDGFYINFRSLADQWTKKSDPIGPVS